MPGTVTSHQRKSCHREEPAQRDLQLLHIWVTPGSSSPAFSHKCSTLTFSPPRVSSTWTATPTALPASCSHHELAQERGTKPVLPPSATPLFFSYSGTRALDRMHKRDGCNQTNLCKKFHFAIPPRPLFLSFFSFAFSSAGLPWAQEHAGIPQFTALKAHRYTKSSVGTCKHPVSLIKTQLM